MNPRDQLLSEVAEFRQKQEALLRSRRLSAIGERKLEIISSELLWREKMLADIDRELFEYRRDGERFWFRRAITTLAIANAAGVLALGSLLTKADNVTVTARAIQAPIGQFMSGLIFAGAVPALLWFGHTVPKLFQPAFNFIVSDISEAEHDRRVTIRILGKLLKITSTLTNYLYKGYGQILSFVGLCWGVISAAIFVCALWSTWDEIGVISGRPHAKEPEQMQSMQKFVDFFVLGLNGFEQKYHPKRQRNSETTKTIPRKDGK